MAAKKQIITILPIAWHYRLALMGERLRGDNPEPFRKLPEKGKALIFLLPVTYPSMKDSHLSLSREVGTDREKIFTFKDKILYK